LRCSWGVLALVRYDSSRIELDYPRKNLVPGHYGKVSENTTQRVVD